MCTIPTFEYLTARIRHLFPLSDADLLANPFALVPVQKIFGNEIRIVLERGPISRSLSHDIQVTSNKGYAQELGRPFGWNIARGLEVIGGGIGI